MPPWLPEPSRLALVIWRAQSDFAATVAARRDCTAMTSVLTPDLLTGFSLRGDAERGVEGWSPDLIAGLDWLRLGELLRAIAANAGCELGPSRVQLDGSVQFAMLEAPKSLHERRALVKLVGWREWGATPETVQAFINELERIREPTRGVLVAPDGFSAAAKNRAHNVGIEAIDAAQLHQILTRLPAEQADFFYTVTTAGYCKVPTCPVCLRKLSRMEQQTTRAMRSVPGEMVFQTSTLVPDPVACGRLEIMHDCEVTFLHEVRAKEMIVRGHVSGDFICEGLVTLQRGATLSGTLAARSVDVQDGAEIIGQFRILDGVTDALTQLEPTWFWRCLNSSGKTHCRSVLFEPHSLG